MAAALKAAGRDKQSSSALESAKSGKLATSAEEEQALAAYNQSKVDEEIRRRQKVPHQVDPVLAAQRGYKYGI